MLLGYEWPGNVRELEHVIERAVILTRSPPLKLEQALQAGPASAPAQRAPGAIQTDSELRALERGNLMSALEHCDWRVSGAGGAADLLGISPSTLRDRVKALGIQRRS